MKLSKSILITLLFLNICITLTACQNDTSYVNDQTGKEISVTTSDDTYTFKLPAAEAPEYTDGYEGFYHITDIQIRRD